MGVERGPCLPPHAQFPSVARDQHDTMPLAADSPAGAQYKITHVTTAAGLGAAVGALKEVAPGRDQLRRG
jgi:hypothetical protein